MGMRRGTFVKMACPSSSTESRRLPLGVRPILEMFFLCAKGSVCDLLLLQRHLTLANQVLVICARECRYGLYTTGCGRDGFDTCSFGTYSTRLKIVTRFPTGEKRQVPSGLYSRFP